VAFRGYFALNGVEIANSSRVASHVGAEIPTRDIGLLTPDADCSIAPIAPGRLLGTPPDGSRLYGPGLALVGDCWTPDNLCFGCRSEIGYDDSWDGLAEFLGDGIYRPELSPWYSTRVPESAEFGGIWVLDVKGLDSTPTQRDVTEMAGDGGAPGPSRKASRRVTFDALLVACSNAGLTYGLEWLNCQLADTNDRSDSTLRYLAAHPSGSAADPAGLVREVHGVVLSQEAQIQDAINPGRGENRQAIMYRVNFELTVTRPHAYSPAVDIPVTWDEVAVAPIKWVHAAKCPEQGSCGDMPVLYGEGCEVERIEVVTSPPPSCGGCMPICSVVTHVFEVPTFSYPMRCRETVANLIITNTGVLPLTLQAYWRRCAADEGGCTDQLYPLQVNGLPATAELHLDGISRNYWAYYAGRKRRPANIVSTPNGAPWRPAIIDRSLCWELVVIADGDAIFDVSMSLADREA
jgi:hypothetical protein